MGLLNCLKKKESIHPLVEEALKWVGTMEKGGDNKGPEVEEFQKAVDGKAQKEPWCMAYVQFCIKKVEEKLNVKSKIFRSEHVLTCWNSTPDELKEIRPKPGFLVMWNYAGTTNGHTGIVKEVCSDRVRMITLEGNTGPQAVIEREGDGVYEKTRVVMGTEKFKILGYIDPFKGLL